MADIRKRSGKKGTTYQVRYPSTATKSGYAFKTFDTLKEARAFVESGSAVKDRTATHPEIKTVNDACRRWLQICEKEGLNGREPVTTYTLENYEYRARFISEYDWPVPLHELAAPHVVAFRSWLLDGKTSRVVAGKVLASLHSILKEMSVRGVVAQNVATGVSIRAESRYQTPISIPSKREIKLLLEAADRLANSKNLQIEKTWRRYRPLLYLAVDSGMRPQEYLALSGSALLEGGVYVDRAIDGSGKEISVTKTPAGRRFIELSDVTLSMVRHYLEHHSTDNQYDLVFPAKNGRWMCRRNWQRRGFNVACEAAGLMEKSSDPGGEPVVKYRPYDLRHFYASRLIELGTNLKKIQSLMGHTGIETTLNVYGHLLDDDGGKSVGVIGLLRPDSQIPCGKSVAQLD